jgi:hypothetical protein
MDLISSSKDLEALWIFQNLSVLLSSTKLDVMEAVHRYVELGYQVVVFRHL